MPRPIDHIAVIRLSAMGDVAMTVPVLRALTKQHPRLNITVISREFFAPFFDGIPNVSFLAADVKVRHKGIFGLYRLHSEILKLNVDAFADLHQVLRSRILCAFFVMRGILIAKIDKGRAEKKMLTRSRNKIFKPLRSTFERYADVFRQLGFPFDLAEPEFPKPPELCSEASSLLGEKKQKWIGVAPFAAHQGKQYPLDLMLETISGLAENADLKILLFGAGSEEIEILKNLGSQKPNVILIAGKLQFREELNLIANLDVMLSMDSGNAHLAAMFGIPVVTLWGATHPFAGFAPFNQKGSNAILSDRKQFPMLPTSVYGNKVIEGYENAMRTISPETIINKITEILDSRREDK